VRFIFSLLHLGAVGAEAVYVAAAEALSEPVEGLTAVARDVVAVQVDAGSAVATDRYGLAGFQVALDDFCTFGTSFSAIHGFLRS
jgi:hypothetical protein